MPFDTTPWPPEEVETKTRLADKTRGFRRGGALALVLMSAFALTLLAVSGQPAADRDPDLARLMHAMAAIKGVFVLALAAAVGARLALPARRVRLLAYMAFAVASGAGLALNLALVSLGLGAVLLHAGLVGGLVLLFCDEEVAAFLQEELRKRAAERS